MEVKQLPFLNSNFKMNGVIFSCSDGSQVRIKSAKSLSQLDIWSGNRVIDSEHVNNIKESLKGDIKQLNLNLFRIVVVPQDDNTIKMLIIDGQHRAIILKEYFKDPKAEDFDVLVAGKVCHTEEHIIAYFKVLNSTKSITWREDPVLRANTYIEELTSVFNVNPKKVYIKPGKTTKPYLSADKLREHLLSKHVVDWKETPKEFVERAIQKNEEMLNGLRLKDRNSLQSMEFRALENKFALALDDKFNWI